jgi:hypothetical protein
MMSFSDEAVGIFEQWQCKELDCFGEQDASEVSKLTDQLARGREAEAELQRLKAGLMKLRDDIKSEGPALAPPEVRLTFTGNIEKCITNAEKADPKQQGRFDSKAYDLSGIDEAKAEHVAEKLATLQKEPEPDNLVRKYAPQPLRGDAAEMLREFVAEDLSPDDGGDDYSAGYKAGTNFAYRISYAVINTALDHHDAAKPEPKVGDEVWVVYSKGPERCVIQKIQSSDRNWSTLTLKNDNGMVYTTTTLHNDHFTGPTAQQDAEAKAKELNDE